MFLTHAKRVIKNFDQIKVILPLKFRSLGCAMVTLRSETLSYMSTPQGKRPKDKSGREQQGKKGQQG